jgi:hypothetical protein
MKTLYVGLLTLLMTVPVAVFAKTEKTNVNFDTTTIVAGKKLSPGKYQVKWNGNGPAVQVNFLKNDKVVATAPAKIIDKSNPYNNAIEAQTEGKTQVLTAIDRSHMTLKFSPNGMKTANE